jgi:hypothetical protein
VKRGRGREGEPTEWTGWVASRKGEIEARPGLMYPDRWDESRKRDGSHRPPGRQEKPLASDELTLAAAAVLVGPGNAQTAERRATLTGASGSDAGKCTIEVYVDGAADVEVRGDRGFLRTVSGQPAQWRRFECSGPMPTNPGDFRFSGVDGRGRQELVQDPRSGRGAAVVRIQDPNGGAEGYTFDLVWRGAGFGSSPTAQPWRGSDRASSPNEAIRSCEDAVRETANQRYGFRDIDFRNLNADDNPGRNDAIVGSFDVRRGNYRDTYRFSCAINMANGAVRGVDISQERDAATADRYAGRDDATSACQLAVQQRVQRDGYRNVQFSLLNADNRRNDWISGTARAQRGNNGRSYDFDVACSVDLNNGSIRSVKVNRR